MCLSTRFPEAIALRKITAPSIVKALVRFFSTFGLPKIVQSDQGTNFMSNVFKQVMKTLAITHRTSSAYHPESQGALERFHQTLKSMMRKYCLETGNDWDEGIPLLMFAVRESVQEALGFSPAELVFGHQVRGPLKILKDKILENDVSAKTNVLDYVTKFKDRLNKVCSLAKESLANAQQGMKRNIDRKAVTRSFMPGDSVLVFLPVPGSSLSARFFGPYEVKEKINETNYVICTPDRKRKKSICHVNMLKFYHVRVSPETNAVKAVESPVISVAAVTEMTPVIDLNFEDDGVIFRNIPQTTVRLTNSEILKDLSLYFKNLNEHQKNYLIQLISEFQCSFKDVPTLTNVLHHDIDVKDARPIKQHAYRVNHVKRSVMRQEVDYLLENGLAKPS
uniref:Integrase catalytic domain-containing protein n=1 Tax=Sinocyclocheilus rhinocerous TaxID=307959 RepID=A0A673M0U5_9TELE